MAVETERKYLPKGIIHLDHLSGTIRLSRLIL